MIYTKTDCNECNHYDVCKYVGNVKTLCDKLHKLTYEPESIEICDLSTMSERLNVNIDISCPNFSPKLHWNLRSSVSGTSTAKE